MLQLSRIEIEKRKARLALHRQTRPHVPALRRTVARKAAEWLYPYTEGQYPGFRKGFSMATGGSLETIRHWLAGRRAMPGEVRARLIEAIRSRLELGHAVLAELEAMETPAKESPVVRIQRARARRNEEAKTLSQD
jgi:hypothetical protein